MLQSLRMLICKQRHYRKWIKLQVVTLISMVQVIKPISLRIASLSSSRKMGLNRGLLMSGDQSHFLKMELENPLSDRSILKSTRNLWTKLGRNRRLGCKRSLQGTWKEKMANSLKVALKSLTLLQYLPEPIASRQEELLLRIAINQLTKKLKHNWKWALLKDSMNRNMVKPKKLKSIPRVRISSSLKIELIKPLYLKVKIHLRRKWSYHSLAQTVKAWIKETSKWMLLKLPTIYNEIIKMILYYFKISLK